VTETRKLAAILVADIVGYSRLAGADEDRILARLRTLRSDLIDPILAVHHGRVVKRTGDGAIVEFRSVVDAVRCAIEIQSGLGERNAGLPPEKRIEYRVGIHLGDVVEEADGDLMGDGVNIAARLEGVSEPGGICLSEDAYRQVRDKVKEDFGDLGYRELKNIARPVRVYALRTAKTATETLAARAPGPRGAALAGLLLLLLLTLGAGWYFATSPRRTASSAPTATVEQAKTIASETAKSIGYKYSIVVLPLVNLSADSGLDSFVDGVTDSLTTDLSKIGGSYAPFTVVARNSAFAYKNKNVDIREIGKALGVRYALEGSVQREQNRVRVNVQLVDAESGNHVWSERFDRSSDDLFALQDEIVSQVGGQLKQELLKADIRRAQSAANPSSMDLYRQAMDLTIKNPTLDSFRKARDLCRRVVDLDPNNATALNCAASTEFGIAYTYEPMTLSGKLPAIEAEINKALSIEPDNGEARLALCGVKISTNRADEGIAECERALVVDPSNAAVIQSSIGMAKMYLGHAEETEGHIEDGLRANPSDIGVHSVYTTAGEAALLIGEDENAVRWLRGAIDRNTNQPLAHFYLAAALVRLGKPDEARAEVKAGLALDPTFTIARARAYSESDNPIYLAQRDRLFEALRKAGVPEL
jgi:TolB-like protein/class 3 adenylate cyclase